jgi:hypothetical protein
MNNSVKKSQLEALIRGIVQHTLNELSTLSSSDMSKLADSNPELDPNVPTADAMTSAEKARMEREAELQRQKDIKQQSSELDSKKKEMEFNKKKLDQQKRFDIPNAQKNLQKLKGAQI